VRHRLNTWSLVLAGGDGRRLQGLTRNLYGVAVPKQFCSLRGGPSLLQEALQRAATVAPQQRVCAVVAAQHRQWWTAMLGNIADENVIVQPQNRGTAHGVLLPLLRIAARDPDAIVVLLPADHYLRDEPTMAASLQRAAALAAANLDVIYLLGIEPEEADTELGYIVPKSGPRSQPARVLRFIEKPTATRAQALLNQGALWNAFIVAASVRALLGLFDGSFDSTAAAMRCLKGPALDEFYQQLRSIDFSRDVLQGNEAILQVLPVPQCGWSDLGTPQRIALILRRLDVDGIAPVWRANRADHVNFTGHLNLADQYAQLQSNRGGAAARFGRVDLHA